MTLPTKDAAPPLSASLPLSAATAPPLNGDVTTTEAAADDEPEEEFESTPGRLPSMLFSALFHMSLVLLLALVHVASDGSNAQPSLVVSASLGSFDDAPINALENSAELDDPAPLEDVVETPKIELDKLLAPTPEMPSALALDAEAAAGLAGLPANLAGTEKSEIGDGGAGLIGNPLMARLDIEDRRARALKEGGTPDSEKAVKLALKWLASHQMPDGSFSFNHRLAPKCKGKCANPGSMDDARVGATALSLLPFLGYGQTHRVPKHKIVKSGDAEEVDYHRVVESALYFLVRAQREDGALLDGGNMYSHGLASIALCEAYGMTLDEWLKSPAQRALDYIVMAQDPVGGGWRYRAYQPGDTSVVGWQLMALKSGHMAYLKVPPSTVAAASDFLDSVQTNYGASYGYTNPGDRPACSAIGLLCRMQLGWDRDSVPLGNGVARLGRMGPSSGNMYYNYYATQVLKQYQGKLWTAWNEEMRDYLVKTQALHGHTAGSWMFNGDDHGADSGGRLYFTAMSAMTLEVYYRYMPLYTKRSVDTKFGRK